MTMTSKFDLSIPDTDKKRLVVIGGGFAGINLVKSLKRNDDLQIVMLDKHNYHTFQPLLYQVATSGIEPDSMAEPLRAIFSKQKNFYFRLVKVEGVNPETQEVKTSLGDLKYDYLAIATGTKPNFFGNKEIEQHAFPLKYVPQALNLRSQILQSIEKANVSKDASDRQSALNFVIVGAGPTGVEVAGAMAEMRQHVLVKDYPDLDVEKIRIFVIEGNDHVLPAMSRKSGQRAQRYLEKLGVELLLGRLVDSYDGHTVKLNDGTEILSETLIWAAGVKGELIPGLSEDTMERGRYLVNEFNQVRGHDNIFAIGDNSFMKSEQFPKGHPGVAQVAIQQGQNLAKNLKKARQGKDMKPFKYFDKGSLAIVGRNKAVADVGEKLHFSGFMGWLVWIFVHIYYLVGFDNKIITIVNWAVYYFTYQRSNRLIIRPVTKPKPLDEEQIITPSEA